VAVVAGRAEQCSARAALVVIEMRQVQIRRHRAPAVRANGAVRCDQGEAEGSPFAAVEFFKLRANRDLLPPPSGVSFVQ
jgi:hypothetical protein